MVRLKSRYLLVQIHYPQLFNPTAPAAAPATSATSHLTAQTPKPATFTIPGPAHLHHHATISFNAPTPDTLTAQSLLHALRQAVTQHYGDLGAGLVAGPAALAVKYFSAATSCFVLRCPRRWVRVVWGALCWVTSLRVPVGLAAGEKGRGSGVVGVGGGGRERAQMGELECVMRVLRVSGSIRKCEEALVQRARELCGRVKGEEMVAAAVGRGNGVGQGLAERLGGGVAGLGSDGDGVVSEVEDIMSESDGGLDESGDEYEDGELVGT